MSATFLLVRHGATDDLDIRLSGRRPGVPLSEAGRRQAAALAAHLAGEPLDLLLSSPLERTRETAEAIGGATGLAVTIEPAIVEIDLGEWTGREFATLRADPRWATWNHERATACCPGGETMAQVQARIAEVMRRLSASHTGQTILLLTHSDVIKAAVCHVLGLGLEGVHHFDIAPASLTRIVFGDWGGRVLAMNQTVGEG